MKIKTKGICKNIDKRAIKKLLLDKDTKIVCKNFLTDDYMQDVQDNFREDKIIKNSEIIEDLHYFTCWTNDMKTINIFNSCCNYVLKNKNLEFILS